VELASQDVQIADSPDDGSVAAQRAAFEQLVVRFQSTVCAVAYSAVRDRGLSEEVAQEAFLIAWRALPALEDHSGLPAWLCGIVRRVAANVRRKRRWEVTTMEISTQAPSPDASALDELLTREEEQLAARALAALAEKYREPLVLFYRGEQSLKQIAAALAISEETAKQRLSRGRKLLKQRLADVERALRATRPGPAFTATVVAAFLAARTTVAAAGELGSAAAKSARVGKPLAFKVALLAVPVVAVALGVASRARRTTDAGEAAPLTARAAQGAQSPSVDPAKRTTSFAHAAPAVASSGDHTVRRTPTVAPAWRAALQRRIDLDFGKASSYAVLQLLSDVSDLPILVHGDIAANVNVLMHDVTVDAALDEVLLQAGAKRADIRCLRIVARSASNVALDGGKPVTAAFDAADLRDVVRIIEPQLGTPIVVAKDVAPTTVTIRFDATPAALALAQLLRQADLGVENAVALEVTPDNP